MISDDTTLLLSNEKSQRLNQFYAIVAFHNLLPALNKLFIIFISKCVLIFLVFMLSFKISNAFKIIHFLHKIYILWVFRKKVSHKHNRISRKSEVTLVDNLGLCRRNSLAIVRGRFTSHKVNRFFIFARWQYCRKIQICTKRCSTIYFEKSLLLIPVHFILTFIFLK